MKTKSLQIGKAMSAALFVLLLSVAGMKNALAQTQVATLQHGDEMSAFYGMNALVEAHSAATDGDIITLSSGSFTKTNITKAITLHGAGCVPDTLGIMPTIVSGNFDIDISNDSTYLIIEGICFQDNITYLNYLFYAKFIKCNMNSILRHFGSTNRGKFVRQVQFINCHINDVAEILSLNNSVSFINCSIAKLKHSYNWDYNDYSTYVNVYNSIIGQVTSAYPSLNEYKPGNLNLYNCIVNAENNLLLVNSYAYNCIEIETVFSSSVQTFNCMTVESYSDVFETFDGSFSNDADYHLNDNIATTFLGNDGREVGIYGGAMPYNPRPSYLILNRCNVANRSTIDGKLSVDIEIIAEDE